MIKLYFRKIREDFETNRPNFILTPDSSLDPITDRHDHSHGHGHGHSHGDPAVSAFNLNSENNIKLKDKSHRTKLPSMAPSLAKVSADIELNKINDHIKDEPIDIR